MLVVSTSAEQTEQIAQKLAGMLQNGDVVRLHGDMGVGKTVFARGLVRGLGSQDLVSSPTYSIMNIYHGTMDIYHFDLYRLEDEEEIYETGLYEYMGKQGVSIVEWPEMMDGYPDTRIIDIIFSKELEKGVDYRTIEVRGDEEYEDTWD